MRKIIAILLCASLLSSMFAGCSKTEPSTTPQQAEAPSSGNTPATEPTPSDTSQPEVGNSKEEIKFTGMNDPKLLPYIEESVYTELDQQLDDTMFVVNDVHTVFISKEYLDEVAYNSKANHYFGFSLSELDEAFDGTKYVFTLDEDGATTVEPLEVIEAVNTEQILKYAAYGAAGAAVICITIVAIHYGIPQQAYRLLFAVGGESAKLIAEAGSKLAAISAQFVEKLDLKMLGDAVAVANSLQEVISSAKTGKVNVGAIIGFLSDTSVLVGDFADMENTEN